MDETNTPEGPNDPEKPSAWPFTEEWSEAWKQLEERVRQEPRQHLLIALVIGYLLQIIPFRRLLGVALKLCLILARPVLFLICAFRLTKYVTKGLKSDVVSK
jgi:hypothetical protein